jgi:hypothetical protein
MAELRHGFRGHELTSGRESSHDFHVKRIFLGWQQSMAESTTEWLWERCGEISTMCIVVPTSQAGRRLREALSVRAQKDDTVVMGLNIVTPAYFLRVDDPATAVPRMPQCDTSGDLLGQHLEQPFLIPIMAMVRKEWFQRVGGMTTRLDYCEDYHFFLKLSSLGGPYQCIGGAPVARYREYATTRIPGSVHMHGFVTALEMIAECYGDRLPRGVRLDYYRARSRAAYARHLLREKQTRKAWITWLGSLGRCQKDSFKDSLVFLGSLIVPVATLERLVYGGPRRLRTAWKWFLGRRLA